MSPMALRGLRSCPVSVRGRDWPISGTADGLRILQAVDGAVTACARDWAAPTLSGSVPELLTDGTKRYLVDYRDGHNQPYHVWGFIAETAFPEDLKHAATGVCRAHAGNIFHDVVQSRRLLNFDGGYGASWQDYFLSLAGMEIGSAISAKRIASPSKLGQLLRERLGPGGPGSSGAVQWWVEHWDIAPLGH